MARRVQHLELDGLADLDHVAGAKPAGHAGNLVLGILVRKDRRAGLPRPWRVAARVIAMLMRVQDLGDRPAILLGGRQALLVIERIDGQRFAGFLAGDQVVEVAIGVRGPDLFDDHGIIPWSVVGTMIVDSVGGSCQRAPAFIRDDGRSRRPNGFCALAHSPGAAYALMYPSGVARQRKRNASFHGQ